MSCAPDKLPLMTELWSQANVPVLANDSGAYQTNSRGRYTSRKGVSITTGSPSAASLVCNDVMENGHSKLSCSRISQHVGPHVIQDIWEYT